MKLVETAIHRPVSTAVGVLLLILFGLIALFRIPIQLTPEVVHPQISVTTTWFGASPEEIEREVVEKQEEQLKSLDGLVKMKSESLDSEGTITLEFEIDTDMNAALLEVANRLNQIADYPDNVDQPVILAMGETSETVAWMILKTKPGNDRDIETYYEFVEDFIQARLERIPGVAKSYIYGGRPRELQVILDPDRLAARNVTIREVIDALRRENVNRSGGDFDEGKRRYIVRTVGAFRTPEDVAGIVVQQRGTTAVHLRDVAEVRLGHRKRREVVRQKGEPALAINCLRKSGANVLTVMKGIHEAIAELNAGVLAEQGLYLEQVYDATKYIESAIGLVRQNIYVGGALAVAVLFLFLRSASSILVIALAIPISIVGTFLLMALFGRNINVISLAGMSFAVGMVVDNAIVVLENIFRHRQMGKGRLEAAYRGTVEVWGAVLASTLTTMTVFLPVIFVKEEAGQLFRDIAIAISCAVALSLLVSITVIPSTSARILGGGVQRGPRRGIGRLGGAFTRLTADFVYAVCRRTSTRLALILLLTLASVGMVYLLKPEAEYLPEGNRNLIFGILLPPSGYSLDELIGIGRQVEAELRPYWEVEPGSPEEAALGAPAVEHFFFIAGNRRIFIGARTYDPKRVREIVPVFYRALGKVPGLLAIVRQASLFRGGQGRTIELEVRGPELRPLLSVGKALFAKLHEVLPEAQMSPNPSLDLGNPEVRIVPKRKRLAELDLSAADLALFTDVLLDGTPVGELFYEGNTIDIRLQGPDREVEHFEQIAGLPIRTPRGEIVPLGSLADIEIVAGPEQIHHSERMRTISIMIVPPQTAPLEGVMRKIEEEVIAPMRRSGELPPSFFTQMRGAADALAVTREALQWNFLLAVVITYLLMASLFESFLYPFVILFSVPLAAAGGFLGLHLVNVLLTYQSFDILTMLGFVILVGIVVNNAILIVHQTLNHLREEGMPPNEAIREAVRNRTRPIFMSMLTTVFGMFPLVLFPGAGSELYRGLGSVVIGGLALSTIFTLLLIPALLSLLLELRGKFVRYAVRLGLGARGGELPPRTGGEG